MDDSIRIGIDFGGTKIEVAALNDRGEFLSRLRVANPGSYDAALVAVRDLVASVEAQTGRARSLGMGVPGSISPRTGVMRNANTTWLNGRNFRADIASALGREVKLANDANCLALSEVVDGAADAGTATQSSTDSTISDTAAELRLGARTAADRQGVESGMLLIYPGALSATDVAAAHAGGHLPAHCRRTGRSLAERRAARPRRVRVVPGNLQ